MRASSWAVGVILGGLLGCSEVTDVAAPGSDGTGAGGDGNGSGSTAQVGGFDAPDEAQSLVAFLEAKEYEGWAKEPEAHASAGPHGQEVRVYYSSKAAAALSSGAATFPAGSASVKELTRDGAVYGYSVWVKVEDATDGGNGFFWYELVHSEGGDKVYGNARGSSDCVGCHSAGKDYDLSTLPFE